MTVLTEDIMPVTESCIRYFDQVFTNQLSLKMLEMLSYLVISVKELVTLVEEMRFL